MNIALRSDAPLNYTIKLDGHEAVTHVVDPATHPGSGTTLEQRIALTKLPALPKDTAKDAQTRAAGASTGNDTAVEKQPLKAATVVTRVLEKPSTGKKTGQKEGAQRAAPKRKAAKAGGRKVKKKVSPRKKKAPPKRRRAPKRRKVADDLGDNPFD